MPSHPSDSESETIHWVFKNQLCTKEPEPDDRWHLMAAFSLPENTEMTEQFSQMLLSRPLCEPKDFAFSL